MSDSTRRRVTTALRSLGSTADGVADTLEAGGWRGLRHDAGACPVSLYLTAVVAGTRGAAVGSDQATVHPLDGPDAEVDLPLAVADFVVAFDRGAYPDLVVTDCDANGDPIDDGDR
ncbi:hypothetical protein [Pseudosporangium ferrugineum]|uniref:Uncharacterized protein n=1 Tax=Pseudosporangium ferrugineum TaxID=439699 RepID=A0A2T0R8X3_9ACTN|nr:hypothetical protein [Pseudosporangium ferrugineum]PRY17626.1 hypothetical protein CLV70_1526 [Pseudosporangium ferrugineum]